MAEKKKASGCMLTVVVIVSIGFVAFCGIMVGGGSSSSSSSTTSTVPVNSSWDGSVHQVKSWIKNNANDAKSIEYIEWSPVKAVTLDGGTVYIVRCKFRGKNAYGGMVLNEKLFRMNASGTVISVTDYGS